MIFRYAFLYRVLRLQWARNQWRSNALHSIVTQRILKPRASLLASLTLSSIFIESIFFSKEKLKVLRLSLGRLKDGWMWGSVSTCWMAWSTLAATPTLGTTRAFLSLLVAYGGTRHGSRLLLVNSVIHFFYNLLLLLNLNTFIFLLETDLLLIATSVLSTFLLALLTVWAHGKKVSGWTTAIDKLRLRTISIFVEAVLAAGDDDRIIVHLLSSGRRELPSRWPLSCCRGRASASFTGTFLARLGIGRLCISRTRLLRKGCRACLTIQLNICYFVLFLVWVGMLIMVLTILLRHFPVPQTKIISVS